MLNTLKDTAADASTAAKSMRGVAVELIDALELFSGEDMRELSRTCPVEFVDLHRTLQQARNLLVMVHGFAAESEAL